MKKKIIKRETRPLDFVLTPEGNIALVNETNETIIFSDQGWFNYVESIKYPEDDIFGNYVVDEKNSNIIYCTYYIESEDKEVTDTMKLKSFIGTNNTLQVENLPTHNGTTMLLTRQK